MPGAHLLLHNWDVAFTPAPSRKSYGEHHAGSVSRLSCSRSFKDPTHNFDDALSTQTSSKMTLVILRRCTRGSDKAKGDAGDAVAINLPDRQLLLVWKLCH